MDENVNGIKKSIEQIIGSSTRLKKKKRTEIELQKEQFCSIILGIEEAYNRSIILEKEFGLGLVNYDESFWNVIDTFIIYVFGKEIAGLIFFYVYERLTDNGEIIPLRDIKNNVDIILQNPSDLWDLIQILKNNEAKTSK